MEKILVVDDEHSIRFTLEIFLEDEGYHVETAENADEALSLIQHNDFDVILSDIILPRMSGIDLLRQIRNIAPGTQVIMMTGEPTLDTVTEALRLGAVDYLQKPVSKHNIIKAVQNALKIKHLNDEKLLLEEQNRNHMDQLEKLVEQRTQALAESEAHLRRQREELLVINQLARKLNESVAVDDTVQCGLGEVANALSPDMALLFLREGDKLLHRGVYPENAEHQWEPDTIHTIGTCLCGLAVSEKRAIYAEDIKTDPRCTLNECKLAGFQSFAALPLIVGPEIIGVVGVATLERKDFTAQAAFLESMAMEISIGVKKSLLYEQVQHHAMELEASLTRIKESEAERKILQEHLQRSQKMEAIGTLASGIAHDFNNILSGVIGFSEVALLNCPDDSLVKKNLGMVLNAGHRAKDLVQQILTFSRQSDEERKPIQLDHTVKEVLKFLRATLPSTIEIQHDLDTDLGYVLANPVNIHQVFMNLCTNAHHAMKADGGVLTVRLKPWNLDKQQAFNFPELKPGAYVKATIGDTGRGIQKDIIDRIFDPYFTTKEKGVGTGLGLAVVHGVVKKLNGAIMVNSDPGRGTTFDIYLPVMSNHTLRDDPVIEKIPRGNEHLMLVDDEQTLIEVGKQMLEYLGYSVEVVSSSTDALNRFTAQADQYDLVITDMTMPNMTGDRLAELLLRIRPDIPIILCTGYGEADLADRAKNIGIREIVMKPIVISKLAHAIRQAIDETS